LNETSKKILSGSYSGIGKAAKSETSLLRDLRQALGTVPPSSDEKVFRLAEARGKYVFYFQKKSGLLICGITDKRTSPEEINACFKKILVEYFNRFKDITETHYDFDDNICNIQDEFNKGSRLSKGVEELEEAHGVLVENLGTLVNRGENLSNLESLADKVNFETREMSRKVSQMKRRAQMEKYKIYALLAFVLMIILYIFFLR
ncbi:hypothetical protein PAEPH01_2279, partial [Pancytospora epiphaga]